jgi:hypothetical protein
MRRSITSSCKKIAMAALLCSASLHVAAQASFDEKLTTAGNIRMTVNNLGMIGNAFRGSYNVLGYPSCEFPANSGIEHLFQGGMWIGCLINNSQVAVSSGAVDDASGYSTGKGGFEFTAEVGASLKEQSSLIDNPLYNPRAISHQDLIADFSDKNTVVPGTAIPISNHQFPLGADVHFEAYNYNFNFANYFVILNYTITNNSANTWDSVYIGYWKDGVVRNVNITPPGGSAFFNKGGNGYLDSLYIAYEFDATGDPGFTNSYVGLKFLGAEDKNGFAHPELRTNFVANYNAWQFQNSADPLYFSPTDDNQKYGKMTSGLNNRPDWETIIRPTLRQANNRSHLMSVGPFRQVAPGESVQIAFALVCAKKKEDGNPNTADNDIQKDILVQNSKFAQTAYNGEDVNFNGILDPGEDRDGDGKITRFILPAPPDIPRSKMIAGENKIDLYWSNNAENSVDPISKKKDFEGYRIYKTTLGFDVSGTQDILTALKLVAEFDSAGNHLFNETGFAAIRLADSLTFGETTSAGDTIYYHYKYTFSNIQNGWQHAVAVTAFDQGDDVNNLQSLESSTLPTLKRVFPGMPVNNDFKNGDPFVYPNPYYASAAWEGISTNPEDKKVIFANLPARCNIRIYTASGDLVDDITHNQEYNGSDIKWYQTYSNANQTRFSGGEHAWDMLSKDNQIIARGLYLFSVKDLSSGEIFKGKFVIIK